MQFEKLIVNFFGIRSLYIKLYVKVLERVI